MNLRAGLVRTWIVLTVLYVAAQALNNPGPDVNLADWRTVMWLFVAPPIGFAVLLAALGWIIAGFRGVHRPDT
jgi:hypothetical protein